MPGVLLGLVATGSVAEGVRSVDFWLLGNQRDGGV